MEYRIQVTEKLQHIETVSAASGTEAVELVRQSYKEEKIVLSSEHFSDVAFAVEHQKTQAYYKSPNHDFVLAHGDCFELLRAFDFKFDMIFADPPYFLSNGGISLQSGKVVCVDKGSWDKGKSQADMMSFNKEWLRLCRDKLKDNGTIWISGTYHNIFFRGQLSDRAWLQDSERDHVAEDQSSCQHLLSLFHLFHRVCHLGKKDAESAA